VRLVTPNKGCDGTRTPVSVLAGGLSISNVELRLFTLRKFPFVVVTVAREDLSTIVLAVAHTKRQPGYWRARLPNDR
jgi:uncharacterized membrane protein YidH (DUF202 family)